MESIAVCGAGYVGLVTAACFARMGHHVCAYDSDATKIRALAGGELPFYEPGLDELVRRQVDAGRLRFSASPADALAGRDVVFITVGTPVDPTGDADLTYVRQAVRDIARYGGSGMLVVGKSTVPVETADVVARLLAREAPEKRFRVASNPEFLREGSAIDDFFHPDRIVVGSDDEFAKAALCDLYAPLNAPTLAVGTRAAETIKYAANAFLALKVSYANELANLCAAIGADVDVVLQGIAADRRIGAAYLQPGLGFGGSCLPKDLHALAHVARKHGVEPTLLEGALAVNARQPAAIVRRIEALLGELDGAPMAVLGLAFKPRTDDVRESPAIALAAALHARGARVSVQDPRAARTARRLLPEGVTTAATPYAACSGARCAVIATEWRQYQQLDWHRIRAAMQDDALIFDARNALDPGAVRAAGLRYAGVGRAMRQAVPA